jgi:hypothetical protein
VPVEQLLFKHPSTGTDSSFDRNYTMDVGSFFRGLPGGEALNNAKDRMIAMGAKTHCNKPIEPYGTILDLQLNTAERSLSLTILLKGEETPVDIHVREYAFSNEEGKSFLVIDGSKIDTSREWLTKLAHDHVGQRRLAVPEKLEWVIRLLS